MDQDLGVFSVFLKGRSQELLRVLSVLKAHAKKGPPLASPRMGRGLRGGQNFTALLDQKLPHPLLPKLKHPKSQKTECVSSTLNT